MANLARVLTPAENLHPRETLIGSGFLSSINSEVVIDCDGCASFALDLRGVFSLTLEVSGSVDGVNWQAVPMKPINQASLLYVLALAGTTQGTWIGECFGFRKLRARCTAYTSGTVSLTLAADTAPLPLVSGANMPTSSLVTAVGAAAAAVTLTLPAPGAGLRQYLTYLSINRFAAATLTAAAAPVTVTTTNFPGSLALSFAAEALPQGQLDRWREDFAFPLAASAQNTAMTVVCPATTGVIWRVTGGYFIAP